MRGQLRKGGAPIIYWEDVEAKLVCLEHPATAEGSQRINTEHTAEAKVLCCKAKPSL